MFSNTQSSEELFINANSYKKLQELTDSPKLVILDDAFQHRSLKCELNIVVSEYNNLYLNDMLLPAGMLRESKKGMHHFVLFHPPMALPRT